MSKKEQEEMANNVLIADALIRIKTLEILLIDKGIITQEEFNAGMESVTVQLAKKILEKAQVPEDVDDILKNLGLKDNQN